LEHLAAELESEPEAPEIAMGVTQAPAERSPAHWKMVFAPGWLAAEPFVEFAPAEIAVTLLEEFAHALVESRAH